MESVLERINKSHFFKTPGGIHPPEQKFLTNDKPIKELPIPKELIIPIQQHIGSSGEILVVEGDHVLKGQALTACSSPMEVPIHAPTSGTIKAIKLATIAHPSGMSEPCIFLEPDGEDKWRERHIEADFNRLTKKQMIEKIANAGISGMGGAGFPTNVKVNTIHGIKYLIINAVECEPYITADDLLIRENTATIIDGIKILTRLLEPEIILIGIENNKPQAIKALQEATLHNEKIKVCVLPTKYPAGGEKQLIQALTGNEVPSGVLPVSMGIITQNVATVFAIAEAICKDIPLIKRVVTVTGQALTEPQNVWALLGTPVYYLLEHCGFSPTPKQRIIMGGPLMGFTLPHINVPVVKISNCVLAPTNAEISPAEKELECIRCGQCAEACPASLLPQELQWYAKAKEFDKLTDLNLFDCIECGACAYVCPSQIPLVQYYRVAKAQIRFNIVQEQKAERAKVRFEARKVRLEKEKQAREAKHQQAIAARKAAAVANPAQGQAANSAVAAALARVKAKKAAEAQGIAPTQEPTTQSVAAQAIARAKAKKAARAKVSVATETPVDSDIDVSAANTGVTSDTKSRAAQAIAKAKAKKAAKADEASLATTSAEQESAVESSEQSTQNTNTESAEDDAKARRARAIAKAKAKKAAKADEASLATTSTEQESAVENTEQPTPDTNTESAEDDAKARRARAIAKAKAKKAAKANEASLATTSAEQESAVESTEQPTPDTNTESAEDDAKARRARAIAKAKAKKAAKNEAEGLVTQAQPTDTMPAKETEMSAADAKKAKIAAAVAKAKAKAKKTATTDSAPQVSDTDKKQKIAAAIAKAKAKKQEETQ